MPVYVIFFFVPRYATAGQVGYLVQDILEIAREQYEPLEFVTAVSHVKQFEVCSLNYIPQ